MSPVVLSPLASAPTALFARTRPRLAVLAAGYDGAVRALLGRFGRTALSVPPGTPAGEIAAAAELLVVPSGALAGLDGSRLLSEALADFTAVYGGTVLVFTQQYGRDYAALPAGDGIAVAAAGWRQDMRCFQESAELAIFHPALAAQTRARPSLSIDGFFAGLPAGAASLLRRTKNAQPVLAVYPHGAGRVVVTSLYTPTAVELGQASAEEIALVRDLVTWALRPAALPRAGAGQSIALSLSLENGSGITGTGARVRVWDPDGVVEIAGATRDAMVPAGGSGRAAIDVTLPADAVLGIYRAEYEILDASGRPIYGPVEALDGRFYVARPPDLVAPEAELSLVASGSDDFFVRGASAAFTLRVASRGSRSRQLRLRWDLPHHRWESRDEASYRGEVAVAVPAGTPAAPGAAEASTLGKKRPALGTRIGQRHGCSPETGRLQASRPKAG
ncbi:MAG: hypothetical protein HYV63_00915 [Candidatus Schekmanbacteria bacterium]|nr:hypothetical protein [Candidatus Schekmanbacteria bacterium]